MCAAPLRHYYSWVLAMLISQHGQLLHTFPRTIFAVKNFTVGGYSCMPDKVTPLMAHANISEFGCPEFHECCIEGVCMP